MKNCSIPGTIYTNGTRYWWKVTFPGEKKKSQIALKSAGSKFATKDRKTAEVIAAEMWQERLRQQSPDSWYGKLPTLVSFYYEYLKTYYLPPSNEAESYKLAIFPLAKYCPDILADEFNCLHLEDFQNYAIEHYDWSRGVINKRVNMIKRMFKWAEKKMLVSIHTYNLLLTVENLHRGRSKAREGKKVGCITMEQIDAVRPFLSDFLVGIRLSFNFLITHPNRDFLLTIIL